MQYTNQLINETSPYLLQHAHNPVDWCAWNEASWKRAKDEDKLVIISIGYSACHWCHVMEHESFEDAGVAQLMNEHFICIKVDREERPDVDQIYMDAVQLIGGRGGWPLNAFALPDGKPIYAGTYFPKDNWKQVLAYFVDYWKNKRPEAIERAGEITKSIKQMDGLRSLSTDGMQVDNDRTALFAKFDQVWDYELGGRRGAPKFPMPVNLFYLLRNYYYTKNEKALQAVVSTLDNMMNGGIYDQVGGGFARYSVDEYWAIPHFEKMLYDSAQLVSLYAEAYQLTGNVRYKEVVYETLEFIERELSDPAGGFYSALDADSEGEEGKFYVWGYDELKSLLGDDFDVFSKVYEVSEQGNFEGHNNLVRLPVNSDREKVLQWRAMLLKERSKRVRPGLDDKVLTSWNALMLKGYCDAYKAFADNSFLERALQCAGFLKANMIQSDYTVMRNYKNGRVTIPGFLDDYSFTCEALLALYEVTFDEQWLMLAKNITEHVIQHFYNVSTGMFFYTSVSDEPLIARKTETSDNVIPASNSSMAKVLFVLGTLLDNPGYLNMSERAFLNVQENVSTHPSFYANWAILADWLTTPPFEVAITGTGAEGLRKELSTYFLPNALISGASGPSTLPLLTGKHKTGETLIHVCQNKTCQLPVTTVPQAVKQIL
ncbi:MAG TPA: thioredoxin domain-containing protein [Chitinophagales bacterium]|nr:thioredoxin domain-containing protein [Chitinophagales bacterium]